VAGDDATLCADAVYELLNATAENYSAVEWTTDGDGTFDDANIINPVYTPGAQDLATGSVTLTFNVTGNEPCGSANDEIMLTFEAITEAFAGEPAETCSNVPVTLSTATAGNYSELEWSTSGDGTFDATNVLNPVYTPGVNDALLGSATLTLTATGNGPCPAVTSEMVVTVLPLATAFAGEDQIIYSDETYTITGAEATNYSSLIWTTAGDGTFDDETVINPVYTPGTNDIATEEVVLTLSAVNELCGNMSDEMVLTVHTSGVNENLAGFKVNVSPNPNNGSFTIELNGKGSELISIRIFNAQSNLIYEVENIRVDKVYSQTIQLDVEKGIYLIRIEGKDLMVNKKIIINK
jgi:hypothetical protein